MKSDAVEILLAAALAEATVLKVNITVAVVDTGGHLLGLRRSENCSFFALEASQKKAVTASQLNMPTHLLAEIGEKIPALQKAFDKDPKVLTLPGGFPVVLAGTVMGGLGIAGGDFAQDKAIGEKALAALSK